MEKDDTISRKMAVDALEKIDCSDGVGLSALKCDTVDDAIAAIKALSHVDAVEVVRCKDCKHRPTGENRDDLEFPDDKCPCKCEDYWYSWKPADEWYCGNGEQK